MENKLVVFKGKEIRRTLHNNEWWFAVADVVEALTNSADPRQYIKKMRQRDSELNSYWGTICTSLRLKALDGKMRNRDDELAKGWGQIVTPLG
jgi:DNA-damage-inducible protein D